MDTDNGRKTERVSKQDDIDHMDERLEKASSRFYMGASPTNDVWKASFPRE